MQSAPVAQSCATVAIHLWRCSEPARVPRGLRANDRLYSKCYCHNADSSGQGLGSTTTTTTVSDMKRTGSIVIVTDASGNRRYHPCTLDIVPERYQCCNNMVFSYVIVR